MEGAYLPGNIQQRMQELMKKYKITQAQLATRIGSTESAISRFVSGSCWGRSIHPTGQILILKNWACRCRRRGICTLGKPMRRSSTAFWKARALQKSPT